MKKIILDIGNVLVKFDPYIAYKKLKLFSNIQNKSFHDEFIQRRYFIDFEAGKIAFTEFFKLLKEDLKIDMSEKDFLKVWNSVLPGGVPGMLSVVENLNRKGASLYVLSNTNEVHWAYMKENFPIFKHFKKIYKSFELKLRKPDKKIFEYVINDLGCEPRELLFIDDVEENVNAARSLGILAHVSKEDSRKVKTLCEEFLSRP